jgi:hypothetical protein
MSNGSYNAAPAPKKKHILRNVLLGAGGLFVLLVVIAAVAGGGKDQGNNAASSGSSGTSSGSHATGGGQSPAAGGASAAPAVAVSGPRIGSKARDGKFQFVITRISHAKSAGDSFLEEKAQGEYTVLHVTVTNIGTVAQTFDDSTQYVYDARGRQFSADTSADIDGNSSSGQVFLEQINPGDTVTGKIYFDMPKGVKAVRAALHDSMFSGGVTVPLIKA